MKRKNETSSSMHPCKRLKSEPLILEGLWRRDERDLHLPPEICKRNLRSADNALQLLTLRFVRKTVSESIDKAVVFRYLTFNDMTTLLKSKHKEIRLTCLKVISEFRFSHLNEDLAFFSITILIRYLSCPEKSLKSHALESLAKMPYFNEVTAFAFVSLGGVSSLLNLVDAGDSLESDKVRHVTKILMQLARCPLHLDPSLLERILRVARRLLLHPDDMVVGDICALLDQMTGSVDGCFMQLVYNDVVPCLVDKLGCARDVRICRHAIGVIYNFLYYGSDDYISYVLDFDVLGAVPRLLKMDGLERPTLEVVTEYMRGPDDDIQKVISSPAFRATLEALLSSDAEVCRKAALACRPLAERGKKHHLATAIDAGLIHLLMKPLEGKPKRHLIKLYLSALRACFKAGCSDPELFNVMLNNSAGLLGRLNHLKAKYTRLDIQFEILHVEYYFLSGCVQIKKALKTS